MKTAAPAIARLADNAYLSRDPAYRATLQALPSPLREQLLYGDHGIGLRDDEWQVIPSAWVRAAQARWTPGGGTAPVTGIGIDVAQGGNDQTVIVHRRDTWFSEPEAIPGPDVPDANVNAEHVERALAQGGVAYIDADGIGASTFFLAQATLGAAVAAYRGSDAYTGTDTSGVLHFLNVRAAAYWRLREALAPSNPTPLALPPSRELRAELTAAHYSAEDRTVKLEAKKDIKARLGRSPDLADAVVMAYWDDPMRLFAQVFGKSGYMTGVPPKPNRREPVRDLTQLETPGAQRAFNLAEYLGERRGGQSW